MQGNKAYDQLSRPVHVPNPNLTQWKGWDSAMHDEHEHGREDEDDDESPQGESQPHEQRHRPLHIVDSRYRIILDETTPRMRGNAVVAEHVHVEESERTGMDDEQAFELEISRTNINRRSIGDITSAVDHSALESQSNRCTTGMNFIRTPPPLLHSSVVFDSMHMIPLTPS